METTAPTWDFSVDSNVDSLESERICSQHSAQSPVKLRVGKKKDSESDFNYSIAEGTKYPI